MRAPATAVLEVQGLYGPFAFPEKLLQKIWLRRDFDTRHVRTLDGRPIEIRDPGRWNSLGGPDFKHARLRFDGGPEIVGDVELHLHASDWAAHGHARDRAYDGVRLHVVLFPPPAEHVTRDAAGAPIPVLVLLPLLLHDLEEYAAEDAIERLADRPVVAILDTLGPLPPVELDGLVRRHADARWRQKVHFARLRVRRLGWTEACHQTALEILGYRYNRAPMLRISASRPLAMWPPSAADLEEFIQDETAGWSLQGLRPANHPRRRLAQYAAWVRAHPDWPAELLATLSRLPALTDADRGLGTAEVRRRHRFTALRANWAAAICGDALGGPRFDNLVCDGFLPLAAVRVDVDLAAYWWHWFPGDVPPSLLTAARQLGLFQGRLRPACHGAVQGLLGWRLEQEAGKTGRGAE